MLLEGMPKEECRYACREICFVMREQEQKVRSRNQRRRRSSDAQEDQEARSAEVQRWNREAKESKVLSRSMQKLLQYMGREKVRDTEPKARDRGSC